MSAVEFDFSEVDALVDTFNAAPEKAKRASSADMTKIAGQLRDDAKAAAPRRTGELVNSISIQGGDGYRIVRATAGHAFYVEFGTSDTAPQPFLWPQAPVAAERLQKAMEGIDPFG